MDSLYSSASVSAYIIRFFAFLAVTCWPLGDLALRLFRIKLSSSLERISASLLIGTIFWTFFYFLLRYFHYQSLLLPLISICILFWLLTVWIQEFKNSKFVLNTRLSISQTEFIFVTVALAVFLYHFSVVWGGIVWTADGGLILTKRIYSDHIWHLTISSELAHSVPPQMPVFAGYRLAYHYFSGLFVVFVHALTRIDLLNLQYYFAPAYAFFIFSAIAFAALKRIFGNEKQALLGYLFMMISPFAADFPLLVHIPIAGSIFFLEIILLSDALTNPHKRGNWFLGTLLLSQILMYETILSVAIVGSLGIGSIIILWKHKRWEPLMSVSLGACLAAGLGILANGRLGGGHGILNFDFPFFFQAVLDSAQVKAILKPLFLNIKAHTFSVDQLATKQIAILPLVLTCAVGFALVRYLQFGIVALPTFVNKIKNLFHQSASSILFYPCLLIGLSLPLVASIAFYRGASFRLLTFAVFLLYSVGAISVDLWWKSSVGKKIVALLSIAVFLIYPNAVLMKNRLKNAAFFAYRSPEEMSLFDYLRTKTPADSVVLHPFIDDFIFDPRIPNQVSWVFEDHYYYGTALGGRRVVMEGSKNGPIVQMLKITVQELDQVRRDIATIYSTQSDEEALRLFRKYNVNYLWVQRARPLKFSTGLFLSSAIENKDHILYEVKSA